VSTEFFPYAYGSATLAFGKLLMHCNLYGTSKVKKKKKKRKNMKGVLYLSSIWAVTLFLWLFEVFEQ
jgi:hypothetical protein